MYRLKTNPILLPNIENIPHKIPQKSPRPSVLFVGRLDKRKRPEVFIELAKGFPEADFYMAGKAEDDYRQKKPCRRKCGDKNPENGREEGCCAGQRGGRRQGGSGGAFALIFWRRDLILSCRATTRHLAFRLF